MSSAVMSLLLMGSGQRARTCFMLNTKTEWFLSFGKGVKQEAACVNNFIIPDVGCHDVNECVKVFSVQVCIFAYM